MEPTEYDQALGLALRKIRLKDRYEAEVRGFLDDFPLETVECVIRFLKDRRIIDDSKTTQHLIERNTGKRSIGIERLRAELLERGAPEDSIDAILGSEHETESQRMLDTLTAKFSPDVSRAKAARFLVSRGFPEESIESVLDRFFGE